MRIAILLVSLFLLTSCGAASKTYHTVSVHKPRYHHTWYKKSRWHKKQIGPLKIDLHPFDDKQGAKRVRMRG